MPDEPFRAAARALQRRLPAVVDDYLPRARTVAPAWVVESPELWRRLEEGTPRSIGDELAAMAAGVVPDAPPQHDLQGARDSAAMGVALEQFVAIYRLGHRVQWEAWLDVVAGEQVDEETRMRFVRLWSAFFFDYVAMIERGVARSYAAGRDTLVGDREQRRMRALVQLLDGADHEAPALGFAVAGRRHLGLVTWGLPDRGPLEALAAALDRELLAVTVGEGNWWAWLAGGRPLAARPAEVVARSRTSGLAWLALGRDGEGVDGFRRTHAEAMTARRAGERGGRRLTAFDDVALEALAGAEPAEARRFVAEELRGIDDDGERSRDLRATLAAWFATGHNAAAAAARLGVHEQTVAQRLRTVEERIGRPVAARRAELETALRLRALLVGEAGGPPAAAR